MMRIVTVGKISKPYKEIFEHYKKLVSRFVDLEHVQLNTGGDLRVENPEEIKRREWRKVERYVRGRLIVLDREGDELDSRGFARMISELRSRDVTFVVGGPLGIHNAALKRANRVVSLSRLTFSHEVAFCVLLEQIFRSFKILSGERYDY